MGMCLTHQITNLVATPVAVATVVSKLLEHCYLASLLSLEPQTINLVLKLDTVLTNVHFLLKQTASYFVTHGTSVHAVF